MLPAFGCCILLLLVPKTVLTLCNLHWWCFSSTNQAFTNVYTYKWALVLQLALCNIYYTYKYIYTNGGHCPMLTQVVYISHIHHLLKMASLYQTISVYITWIMVIWCIPRIYHPKISAFGHLQCMCTANVLWPQFGSYIRGIHCVTMIYILIHSFIPQWMFLQYNPHPQVQYVNKGTKTGYIVISKVTTYIPNSQQWDSPVLRGPLWLMEPPTNRWRDLGGEGPCSDLHDVLVVAVSLLIIVHVSCSTA